MMVAISSADSRPGGEDRSSRGLAKRATSSKRRRDRQATSNAIAPRPRTSHWRNRRLVMGRRTAFGVGAGRLSLRRGWCHTVQRTDERAGLPALARAGYQERATPGALAIAKLAPPPQRPRQPAEARGEEHEAPRLGHRDKVAVTVDAVAGADSRPRRAEGQQEHAEGGRRTHPRPDPDTAHRI